MNGRDWFSETLTPGIRLSFEAQRVIRAEDSGRQKIALFDNAVFGRVLLLDEAVQVTSADEFMYHEMMAHLPLLAHGAARDVLVIGGGDCGLAEEVLKHAAVRRLVQVEIDPEVVSFAREHFASFNAPVFGDERFELVIGEGGAFVRDTERRFDAILVDSTDPVGPGAALFTDRFYEGVRRCLKPGGIMVSQNGVPFLQRASFVDAVAGLSRTFAAVSCYLLAVPTYFGGHMALCMSAGSTAPFEVAPGEIERRFAAARLETRYYTPAVHAAAFALPRYIADALADGRAAA